MAESLKELLIHNGVQELMKEKVSLIKATPTDLPELQSICRETYSYYFGNHWLHDGLEAYLEEQYGTEILQSYLKGDKSDFFFIVYREERVGFLKITYGVDFDKFEKELTCELEKMYIYPKFKGKGIGETALQLCIEHIRRKSKKVFFLGVLDSNTAAISFYKKVGFEFHSNTQLDYADFKQHLKGLDLMYLMLG